MESWCELLTAYPEHPEPRDLSKALHTANVLMTTELAPFEIEWLVQTLFWKPVKVLDTIAVKRTDETWLKSLSDSFKIISLLVSKHWNVLEKDYETIVKLYSLPYDPQTKKAAISCLINILRNPGVDIGNAKRHIDALESANTCQAPLALLVGNICRYCPEGVDQEYIRVWRIYLNMLQHQSKTDTIVNAILQGVDGLFVNFGRDLPITQINEFYKEFSRKCAMKSKCIEPLLSILKSHAGLFKESLSEDKILRLYLWGINTPNVKDALLQVYRVVFDLMSKENVKLMIETEIVPRMNSDSSLVKHTALRIAFHAKIHHKVSIPNLYRPDALEFQMRYRSINYYEADLVSLCLGSQEGYVKSLLLTCIMYYDNIPVSLRHKMVVDAICHTSKDIRKVALTLLVELSRQDGGLAKYADLWRALLDSEIARNILEDILKHITVLLKDFLETSVKDLEQILSLLHVLSFILSVSETDHSSQYCDVLRPIIVELANAISVCPTELLTCKIVCTEMFKEDSMLKELFSKFQDIKSNDSLTLIEEIFNKPSDTRLQIKGLAEMDSLLKSKKDLDYKQILYILKKIVKLKSKNNNMSVDERILQRDLALFVGENGNLIPKENFFEDLYSLELENRIYISIDNTAAGKLYKIDLLRILQISLAHEDLEVLFGLLTIITVHLRDKPEPGLQTLVWKVLHGVLKSGGSPELSPLRMCATLTCGLLAIQCINEESNPDVRRYLCEGLEVMLLQDPGSEKAGELLTIVVDELVLMIDSLERSNYEAGLDLTKIVLNALKENDSFAIKYLPTIIILLSKNIVKEIYKMATDILIDKIDIFEEIDNIISGILNNILLNDNKMHLVYVLEILKRVFDIKEYESSKLVQEIVNGLDLDAVGDKVDNENNNKIFVKKLQILSISKNLFDFNKELCDTYIKNGRIVDKINVTLKMNKEIYVQQNVCRFLNEHAVYFIEDNKEKTIECLSILIENISPTSTLIIKNDLSVCLSTYKTILNELPAQIKKSYHDWCQKLNIDNITEELKKVFKTSELYGITDLSQDIWNKIQGLGIMVQIFELAIPDTEVWTQLVFKNEDSIRNSVARNLLIVSEKCLTENDFENILKENEEIVLKFLNVYFERVLHSDKICVETSLFVKFLKYYVNSYCKNYAKYSDRMLDVVEKIWPYFLESDFDVKLTIASDLLRLPTIGVTSPVSWIISAITGEGITLEQKVKLVTLLPGGEAYSSCYRHLAGTLPIQLSEMCDEHASVLRCLLDSLATTGDMVLLDIVLTLAAADETKGWWDDAIVVCMASLADKRLDRVYTTAYNAVKVRPGLGLCGRVFIPLLKHSSRTFCEDYITNIIQDLLLTLRSGFIEFSDTEKYRKRILNYINAFNILQVIFDKVSIKSLKSGVINTTAGSQEPWYLVKEVCKCSITLRNKVRCPDNASANTKDVCLRLQCSAYNCLVSAICKRSPSQKQYTAVFDTNAWSRVVDPAKQYDFWPRGYWTDDTLKRQAKPEDHSTSGLATTSTYTATVRTRIFMATLTENPLQYDMIPNEDEDDEDIQEDKPAGYENHPLNSNGCLSSITLLLSHSSSLEHTDWLTELVKGLKNISVNGKWTLAQAICNIEADLKQHAEVLIPALLDVIVTSPRVIGDKTVLNNLHLEILSIIIKWNLLELSNYEHLSLCKQYLISTCIEHYTQQAVYRRLLNILNTLLQMYGTKVNIDWSELQKYCEDIKETSSYIFPIIQRILKNGITIPNLITNLLTKFDSRLWISTSKLPEIFGLALSLKRHKDEDLSKFWQILSNIKSVNVSAYVKVLLYAQRAEYRCCNEHQFKLITDLASKVEKSRCLSIIAVYLDNCKEHNSCMEMFETIGLKELLDGEHMVEAMKVVHGGIKFIDSDMKIDIVNTIAVHCRNSSIPVRKQAFAVLLKVFQDLIIAKDENSAKRRALQASRVLETLQTSTSLQAKVMMEVSRGILDSDEQVTSMMRDGVEVCLSKDMPVRFAELFYIIFYLGRSYCKELSKSGYVFLELLFRDMKRQDGYTDVKLSDQPLPPSDTNIGHITYATTGMMVGKKQTVGRRAVDVQIAIGDLFDIFVECAKSDTQICQDLCLKVMKCLQTQPSSPRFDLDAIMARLLGDLLVESPNCMTPLILEASRLFLDSVNAVTGLKESLNVLKTKISNAEALSYYNILIEDLALRREGRDLFNYSVNEELDFVMKDQNQEFNIEALTNIFGHLSNWDDLRIQDKESIERCLPILMTDRRRFKSCLVEYFESKQNYIDYNLWFNKMVASYASSKLDEVVLQYKENWFIDIGQWPTREFVTNAVIEAIKWPSDEILMACDIKSSDCLAEWAARLMIRSAYFDKPTSLKTCRRDELLWCSEANRRDLPYLALQCIERNISTLLEEEALLWSEENVRARRLVALRDQDISKLQKALEVSESQDKNTSIGLKKLILQIRKDLGVLNKPKLDELVSSINKIGKDETDTRTSSDIESLKSFYEIAMEQYDELWNSCDITTQEQILLEMSLIVGQVWQHSVSKDHNLSICMLLNRLSQYGGLLSEGAGKRILDQISIVLPSLDAYSIRYLITLSTKFPGEVWTAYSIDQQQSVGVCEEYLQLICDPAYTLAMYCSELSTDWSNHQTIFDRIRCKFDSCHRGTDYISLNTIKKRLLAVDNTDAREREKQLNNIGKELSKKSVKPVLRLSQLSPKLMNESTLETQRESLRNLLGLPPSVYVVKFSEQIQVFTDSIRRPCVLSALLSNGKTKKYIIKSGEILANDASVLRSIKVLNNIVKVPVRSYNVTTLSEDCAIIEYLENYQRLQELMRDKIKIPVKISEELILSPSLALEQYTSFCNKIPVHTLRTSIEERCASLDEFISKKKMFLETLSSMTIVNWLFGIGDRHLQNIMINKQDGGLCSVDMASVFQYGLRELVPARLTGNVLAVCDVKVLESRLQHILLSLKQSRKLYEAYVQISFYWKGRDFSELKYLKNILEGSMVSYEITRTVILNSNIKHKQEYIDVLDSAFVNFKEKKSYSVEEQIYYLLQHCTDPKILSITPRGWEAWV